MHAYQYIFYLIFYTFSFSIFLKNIRFRYYKVRFFNPSQRFSSVSPLLSDAYRSDDEGTGKYVVLDFTELFDVSSVPTYTDQIGKLDNSTTIQHCDSETSLIMQLLNKVMLPMFSKVTLEKNRKYGKLTAGIESEHIGMGTTETWHGTPDFRIGCVCMLSTGVNEFEFKDTENISTCSPYSTPSLHHYQVRQLCQQILKEKKFKR